jgi:hypothetical protein
MMDNLIGGGHSAISLLTLQVIVYGLFAVAGYAAATLAAV